MKKFMKIGSVKIGPDYKPVVIAELGINHNGSLERAIKIADAAIKSGAKIIKHQTHIAEDEMSLEAKKIKPGNLHKLNISLRRSDLKRNNKKGIF